MNLQTNGSSKSIQLASWVFGSLLLLFVLLVFIFAPEELPPYKHRQLGFICALLAGIFAYFFIGTNKMLIEAKGRVARFVFRAGGGASLFALVLLWWGSPYSLVKIDKRLKAIEADTKVLVGDVETRKERSLDSLSPSISPLRAYEHVMATFERDLHDYDLIEVLGSYYICLEPPNRIFHRFPEWTFTFRHRINRDILQYQLFDAHVPRPPVVKVSAERRDDLAYYIVFKEEYDSIDVRRALEGSTGERLEGSTYEVAFFLNDRNVAPKIVGGTIQTDRLLETKDSDRYKVIGRYQALGRAYEDPPATWLKIEGFAGDFNVKVSTSRIAGAGYLDTYRPIDLRKWKIDVDEAINIATAKGAAGLRPGQSNYPGILRLYSINRDNLDGIYWFLPYRLDLHLFVVDAQNGTLLVFNGPQVGFEPR